MHFEAATLLLLLASSGTAETRVHDGEFRGVCDAGSRITACRLLTAHRSASRLTESYHYIIATIADPTDPPAAIDFDRQIESIIAAAQSGGYTLDRYAFPWKRPGDASESHRSVAESTKDGSASAARNGSNESSSRQDRAQELVLDPTLEDVGAIIFRRECSDHPHDHQLKRASGKVINDEMELEQRAPDATADHCGPPLAILVVPETPTFGVQTWAMREALQIVEEDEKSRGSTSTETPSIKILGPAYSGSATSLSGVLAAETDREFEVISGAATNFNVQKILTMAGNTTFHATVVPDEMLQDSMVHYLVELLDLDPRDIALLVEQDSSYGQGIIASAHIVAAQRQGELGSELMVLPYPMNISSYRETLQRQQHEKPRPEEELVATRSNLERALEIGEPTHVPVDFSRASMVSSELAIKHIVDEINRHKFKYVGIAASQVPDRIFLARLVRQNNPDLTIFFLESDILYTHEDLAAEMYGSLVVSTYPLFARNQMWSYPYAGNEYERQFTSGTAEGIYNATLLLLGLNGTSGTFDKPLEYGGLFAAARPPTLTERLQHWETRGSVSPIYKINRSDNVLRPSVWVSVVGRGSFYPIVTYYPYSSRFSTVVCGSSLSSNDSRAEEAGTDDTRAGAAKDDDPEVGVARSDCLGAPNRASAFVAAYRPDAPKGPESLDLVVPPSPALFLLVLISLFTALHGRTAMVAMNTKRRESRWSFVRWASDKFDDRIRNWWCWEVFDPSPGRQLGSARSALYATASLIVLTSLCTLLARWFIGYPFIIGARFTWAYAMLLVSTVAYFAAILSSALGLSALVGWYRPPLRRMAFWIPIAGAIVALIGVPYRGPFTSPRSGNEWDAARLFAGQVLFTHRATALGSGVTPALPIIFFAVIGYGWAWAQIHRWRTNWELSQVDFDEEVRKQLPSLETVFQELTAARLRLERWFWQLRGWLLVAAVVGFAVARLYLRIGPTFDGAWFGRLFWLAFSLVASSMGFQVLRLLSVWRHIRRMLIALAQSPLFHAFDRLPKRFWSDLPSRVFMFAPPRIRDRLGPAIATEYLTLFRNHQGAIHPNAQKTEAVPQLSLREGDELVADIVEDRWAQNPDPRTLEMITNPSKEVSQKDTTALFGTYFSTPAALRARVAEDYLAARFADVLELLLAQVRKIIAFCTVSLLLLLLTVHTYPFEPTELISTLVLIAGAVVMMTATAIFILMNRDEVISLLSGTEGGKITWDLPFVTQLGVYGALPVITVLATQVPALGRPLLHAVAQLLHALK